MPDLSNLLAAMTSTVATTTTSTTSEATHYISAVMAGQARTLIPAILLSVFVYILRQLRVTSKIPPDYDKWVAMTIAMTTSIIGGLTTGQDVISILLTAAEVGMASIGGWELILKPFLGKAASS